MLCEESYPPWRAPTGLESLFADAKAYVVARVPPYGRHRSRGSGRVLDVGLGRGDVARAFVTSGWETHGLDMSSTAVDVARSCGVDARLGTLDDPPCHLQNFTIPALNHAARAVGSSGARVRRCTSMVGLTISLRFAIAGKWAHGPKWRKRFLAASAASSPLVWAIGRLSAGTART